MRRFEDIKSPEDFIGIYEPYTKKIRSRPWRETSLIRSDDKLYRRQCELQTVKTSMDTIGAKRPDNVDIQCRVSVDTNAASLKIKKKKFSLYYFGGGKAPKVMKKYTISLNIER